MDLPALPEGCIATIVSLTTPRDAGTMSLVSRSFRSAAGCDPVWDKFFPPDIDTVLSSSSLSMSVQQLHVSSSSASLTKKEQYLALRDNPVLIEQGKLSFSLDKWSGKKCYMIAARALSIVWSGTPQYWKWISLPDSRFEEVAELVTVCWLEIRGQIQTRMLSPSTLYKTYLVLKSIPRAYGFDSHASEVTIGLIGEKPTKQKVFLDAHRGHTKAFQPGEINEAQYPKERNDWWLEIEMGEYFCQGGEGEELEMVCWGHQGGHWKGGLIFQGIDIRPKGM
ncbi:hypothetical protein FF1_003690 [Malus domestica]